VVVVRLNKQTPSIGVLALQGGFKEHITTLCSLGIMATEVRLPRQLAGLDGLIIPGGESTAISQLLNQWGLHESIQQQAIADKLAIWGTCAGAILLARQTTMLDVTTLGLMDIVIKRNAFGRQIDSCIKMIHTTLFSTPFSAVFIRAPVIPKVGPGVTVLATINKGDIVAVRQGKFLATAFHPELSSDNRWHRYFIEQVLALCPKSR